VKRLIYLVAGGLMLFVPPVFAGVREDVLAAMQRCSAIQDDRTWLDCTYGAQQLMRAKLGLAPAPDFQQRLVPPASFASTHPLASETVPPVRRKEGVLQMFNSSTPALVTSVLVGVRYDAQGGFIATLENGQVWHQVNLEEGSPKARLTLGAKVTIQRGAMWSYDLKVDRNPHNFKVDREA
jgi:hypothetical protein